MHTERRPRRTSRRANQFLQATHSVATANLLGRAALYNKLAKVAASASDRKRLYILKAVAVSRLLAVGAGRVEEILFDRGIATIALVDGRRQHVRLGHLSNEGSAVVESTLRDRLERRRAS